MMILYRAHRFFIKLWSVPINRFNFLMSSVKVGKHFYDCGVLYIRNFGKIELGERVSINSHRVADPIGGDTKTILGTGSNGYILLHNNVSLSNTTIFSNCKVEIGEQTCIGGGVKIYDTDFHSTKSYKRLNGNVDVPCKPVFIGKKVFIGAHSIILKGVTIGDEAVIGAGSIVAKDIPAKEIWAGNPAKFIKKVE